MTILEDLMDLEATVTDAFANTHKEDTDPETLAAIAVETDASKKFATSTDTAIKAAMKVVKTVSERIEERMARDHRQVLRGQSQEDLDGQHHSDPPNKVTVATDLKPEQLCDTINQFELDNWYDRAETYAEASNILTQTNTVQLGYFQALVKPEMWVMFKEYCEANLILPVDINFERGLEILKETYYKKNDMFLLKLRTSADTFRGRPILTYSPGFSKGWGLSAKLGKHSAIWGKLGTALQAYALNPCAKFPPNPTSRKVNT